MLSKAPEPEARDPLVSIVTAAPLELVCVDFWSAEDVDNKSVDALVVSDHFTRLACTYPCSNQDSCSCTVEQLLFHLWVPSTSPLQVMRSGSAKTFLDFSKTF